MKVLRCKSFRTQKTAGGGGIAKVIQIRARMWKFLFSSSISMAHYALHIMTMVSTFDYGNAKALKFPLLFSLYITFFKSS